MPTLLQIQRGRTSLATNGTTATARIPTAPPTNPTNHDILTKTQENRPIVSHQKEWSIDSSSEEDLDRLTKTAKTVVSRSKPIAGKKANEKIKFNIGDEDNTHENEDDELDENEEESEDFEPDDDEEFIVDDEEEDDDESDDMDDTEEEYNPKKPSSRKSVTSKRNFQSENDDDDDDDVSVSSIEQNPKLEAAPMRITPNRRSARYFAAVAQDQEEITPTRRSTRSTVQKTNALIAATMAKEQRRSDDDEQGEEDMDSESNMNTSNSRGSNKTSKEEFSLKRTRASTAKHKSIVAKESWMDDDDENEEESNSFMIHHKRNRRENDIMPRSTNVGNADNLSFDDSSDSKRSPKIKSPNLSFAKTSQPLSFSSPTATYSPPICASTHDVITLEKLPRLHVCYLAPDSRTRHCFCLDTLYQASLMAGSRRYRNDGSLAFLQPPHFRTVMDEHLEDQIASRFGRRALIIEESTLYKKITKASTILSRSLSRDIHTDDSDDMQFSNTQSFEHRLNRYFSDLMGSGDLYCCPLCYSEAHRRFRGYSSDDDDSDDDDSDDNVDDYDTLLSTVTASKVDPMSILGGLDDNEFNIASCFCFKKLIGVKQHIIKVHNEDFKRLDGNTLLKKFKIRDQDGLLQQHLIKYYKGRVPSGAMQRYWVEGNDGYYVLLRSLIDEREKGRITNEDEDDVSEFSTSFPRRANIMWKYLRAPFEKNVDAVGDFIADDSEDVGDTGPPVPIFEKPVDLEEDIIQALRNKTTKRNNRVKDVKSDASYNASEDSFDSGSDKNSEESEELEIVDVDEYSDASSEDSWCKRKRTTSKLNKSIGRTNSSAKTTPLRKMKSLHETDDDDDDSLIHEIQESNRGSGSKTRRILDSDVDSI